MNGANIADAPDREMSTPAKQELIEHHAVVGDLHTVALVGIHGSVDFMCFPTFSSPTIFASLLDVETGGSFEITPLMTDVRYRQMYLPDTNVLITRFLSSEGLVEVTDCMPIEAGRTTHQLLRRAQVVRGRGRIRMRCAPRFDYARAQHDVERRGRDVLFLSRGTDRTAFAAVEQRAD
jgi:GH15 family glucan-1,4-alpha-glucosidase